MPILVISSFIVKSLLSQESIMILMTFLPLNRIYYSERNSLFDKIFGREFFGQYINPLGFFIKTKLNRQILLDLFEYLILSKLIVFLYQNFRLLVIFLYTFSISVQFNRNNRWYLTNLQPFSLINHLIKFTIFYLFKKLSYVSKVIFQKLSMLHLESLKCLIRDHFL